MKEHKFTVDNQAVTEVVTSDDKSWVRWYVPGPGGNWTSNGNIDLPPGKKYRIKEQLGNTLYVVEVEKEYKEYFDLANDLNFGSACELFTAENKKGRPFATIGDRIRLIQHLENWGFEITRKK
ncbi:hypothetical protein UFOVP1604_144 [uncultured Caudovirales phage]|uniref:Uncharacterized protein n=1 Tax=uncultured Caudovirales phage TaxID=2100421 RepID=A0A6J5SWQ5_9CAUD|nr:hypothetical protein UFOVP1604_144 [uncultured Caudovirales phage]